MFSVCRHTIETVDAVDLRMIFVFYGCHCLPPKVPRHKLVVDEVGNLTAFLFPACTFIAVYADMEYADGTFIVA